MNKNDQDIQTISDLYQVDFDAFWSYPNNYPKYLPKRDEAKYININFIEDYEFTYCIAFEMLIRTEEYKRLMSIPDDEIDENWEKSIQELGLDPTVAISIKNSPHPIGLFKGLPFSSPFQQDTTFITIQDVEEGLKTLIKYYLEKQEVYVVKKQHKHPIFPNTMVNEYKFANKATLNSILKNLDNYYVPCNPNHNNLHQDKCQLSTHLYIVNLEKRFVETIADKIPKNKNIKFYPMFKRPQLRFDESRIFELEINLDLPKKELTAFIEKIKDEYDKNSAIAKNVLDIISDEQNDESLELPKIMRKSLADAFFCYDYYKSKKEYVESFNKEEREKVKEENENNSTLQEKLDELKSLENEKKEFLKMYTNIEGLYVLNEQIRHIQLEIEIELSTEKIRELPTTNKQSKNYVFKENRFKLSKINSNSAYNYYTKLAPFIEKGYYKHLLIGNR
ncbi:hypothetical protein KJ877_08865 [bacterium]|nr:hypothetical protein [bacterium]MBU1990808.1 hypothetical protein [bacterium]